MLDGIDILLEVLQDRRFSAHSEHRARIAEALRIFQDADKNWFLAAVDTPVADR